MSEFFTEADCDFPTGAKIDTGIASWVPYEKYISVRKANRILRERGRVVECYELKESGITDEHGPGWTAAELSTRITQPESTHRGLLLIGEPISKDTAESLLRELIKWTDTPHDNVDGPNCIADRARKLLERG